MFDDTHLRRHERTSAANHRYRSGHFFVFLGSFTLFATWILISVFLLQTGEEWLSSSQVIFRALLLSLPLTILPLLPGFFGWQYMARMRCWYGFVVGLVASVPVPAVEFIAMLRTLPRWWGGVALLGSVVLSAIGMLIDKVALTGDDDLSAPHPE